MTFTWFYEGWALLPWFSIQYLYSQRFIIWNVHFAHCMCRNWFSLRILTLIHETVLCHNSYHCGINNNRKSTMRIRGKQYWYFNKFFGCNVLFDKCFTGKSRFREFFLDLRIFMKIYENKIHLWRLLYYFSIKTGILKTIFCLRVYRAVVFFIAFEVKWNFLGFCMKSKNQCAFLLLQFIWTSCR